MIRVVTASKKFQNQKNLIQTMHYSTCFLYTVWKFENFAVTQILREVNFGDSTSAKSDISTHLEVLNFALYEILHFLKAEMYKINKIYGLKNF